jgi:hypothetical protein
VEYFALPKWFFAIPKKVGLPEKCILYAQKYKCMPDSCTPNKLFQCKMYAKKVKCKPKVWKLILFQLIPKNQEFSLL